MITRSDQPRISSPPGRNYDPFDAEGADYNPVSSGRCYRSSSSFFTKALAFRGPANGNGGMMSTPGHSGYSGDEDDDAVDSTAVDSTDRRSRFEH